MTEDHRVLIFAPHPDDESLACAGVMARSARHVPDHVGVVILTNGEAHLQACAYYHCHREAIRMGRQVSVLRILGRQAGAPRAWLVAYVADDEGKPLRDALVSCEDRSTATNWEGYALLEIPLSALRPTLAVSVRGNLWHLPPSRTLTSADRELFGQQRRQESCRALSALGVASDAVHFWNYPDHGLSAIPSGEYSSGGLAPLGFEARVRGLVDSFQPDIVYLPHAQDADDDHHAAHDLVVSALRDGGGGPQIRSFLIHARGSHDSWPPPCYRAPDRQSRYRPDLLMSAPPGLPDPDLRFPLEDALTPEDKGNVLRLYDTQIEADDHGFLLAFAKQDEIFWQEQIV